MAFEFDYLCNKMNENVLIYNAYNELFPTTLAGALPAWRMSCVKCVFGLASCHHETWTINSTPFHRPVWVSAITHILLVRSQLFLNLARSGCEVLQMPVWIGRVLAFRFASNVLWRCVWIYDSKLMYSESMWNDYAHYRSKIWRVTRAIPYIDLPRIKANIYRILYYITPTEIWGGVGRDRRGEYKRGRVRCRKMGECKYFVHKTSFPSQRLVRERNDATIPSYLDKGGNGGGGGGGW